MAPLLPPNQPRRLQRKIDGGRGGRRQEEEAGAFETSDAPLTASDCDIYMNHRAVMKRAAAQRCSVFVSLCLSVTTTTNHYEPTNRFCCHKKHCALKTAFQKIPQEISYIIIFSLQPAAAEPEALSGERTQRLTELCETTAKT